MNYDFIKRVMLVILGFLIVMILLSYCVNKGVTPVEEIEEDIDVVEGSYIDENSLYIINQTDVYDYFDTYDNAELCIEKVTAELVRYGSELTVAKLTNIECADNILVFDDGQIVEQGNHEQLVNANGLYSKLWNAQAQYYRT